MADKYELLPAADENERLLESDADADGDESDSQLHVAEPTETSVTPALDPRFHPPTPSPYKRAALLLFIVFLFWLAYDFRKAAWEARKPHVVHASRYIFLALSY